MKTLIIIFAFVAIVNPCFGQQKSATVEKTSYKKAHATSKNEVPRRRGYIGITVGPSIPLGDFAKKENFQFGSGLTGPEKTSVGLQLNLINFGYLFSNHLGLSAAWFGAAYNRSSNRAYELDPWSCGGIMVGPLLSFDMSEKVEWGLTPMLGRSVCSGMGESTTKPQLEQSAGLVFNMGSVHRFHVSKNFSLLLTANFFFSKLKFGDWTQMAPVAREQPIKALSLGFGLAYRIK